MKNTYISFMRCMTENISRPYNTRSMAQKLPVTFFLVPFLLLIPVLYYSLSTPFALVDDYGMCYYVEYLDSLKKFLKWGENQFFNFGSGRYRPFFDLYNMITWKVFGPLPWLHHLSRWLLHFTAMLFFSAALLSFTKNNQSTSSERKMTSRRGVVWLPLGFLIYIWLFFPNSPTSRLGPQEVNTVFFLGLCNWMMALHLIHDIRPKASKSKWKSILIFLMFYTGYLGLSLSKEINIAVMLWILFFYYSLLITRFSWKRVFLGLPLVAVFIYTLLKIVGASKGHYGIAPVTPDLVMKNSVWIFNGLFQVHTSLVVTCVFAFLMVFLLLFTGLRVIKYRFCSEQLFVLFLLGQFIVLYFMVCTSWAPVLRYWYILVPILAILLAFSVKSLLEVIEKKNKLTTKSIQVAGFGFLLFFISCNYYNFLMQTIVQHSLRHAEAKLIAEISDLHDSNQYVHVLRIKGDPEAELVSHLIAYFRRFSPRFYEKKYIIYTAPPRAKGQEYYPVTMHPQTDFLHEYAIIPNEKEYKLLSKVQKIAALLQKKRYPHLSKDAGVHLLNWHYQWIIYNNKT